MFLALIGDTRLLEQLQSQGEKCFHWLKQVPTQVVGVGILDFLFFSLAPVPREMQFLTRSSLEVRYSPNSTFQRGLAGA